VLVCAAVAFVGSNDITIGIVQTFEGKWEEMPSRLVRTCAFFKAMEGETNIGPHRQESIGI
jgi:hypothetical protein